MMTETSKRVIPISKKWDVRISYEDLKKSAKYAYYSPTERYPVKVVTQERRHEDGTIRIIGYAIGTWQDGIMIKHQFNAPAHTVDRSTLTQNIDSLVRRFLRESMWW